MAGMAGAEGDRGWMGGEGRRRMAAGCIGLGWFGLMTGGGGVRGKRRRTGWNWWFGQTERYSRHVTFAGRTCG